MPVTTLVDLHNRHSIKDSLQGIVTFLAAIWMVFVLDRFLPLEQFGLIPREPRGLIGIVTMPFLHGDFNHLLGNSIPLAVTLMLLAGSRAHSGAIVVLIAALGGSGLWLFGREALHIGASGLVFGLIAFHLFAGLFERHFRSVVIAIVVGLLYASTLLQGVLPINQGVSWEGHLIGAIAGAVVAMITAQMYRRDTS